jgi:hypothetical protein
MRSQLLGGGIIRDERLAAFRISCEISFLYKFLHCSICTVCLKIHAAIVPKYIFAVGQICLKITRLRLVVSLITFSFPVRCVGWIVEIDGMQRYATKLIWPNLKQYRGNCLKELKKITISSPNKSQKLYCLIQIVRCVLGVEAAIRQQTMEFIMLKVFVRQNSSGYGTNEEL